MGEINNYFLRRLKKSIIKRIFLGTFLAILLVASIMILPLNYLNPNKGLIFHMENRGEAKIFDITIKTINLEPNAPQYDLPLNISNVKDLDVIVDYLERDLGITMSYKALSKLSSNGFVVIRVTPRNDSYFLSTMNYLDQYYINLLTKGVPIFITTDAVLHVYHIVFMNILRKIETSYLHDLLDLLLTILIQYIERTMSSVPAEYEAISNSFKTILAFLCVPKKLLDPDFRVPSYISDIVSKEIELINNAEGYGSSPIMNITIDYSLFKPRSYYTSSELLQRYFKAMMWLGYAYFPLDDPQKTLDAVLLTLALDNARLENNSIVFARDLWERIYSVTAFFVGYSDDLTIYDYEKAINEVYGSKVTLSELNDSSKIKEITEILEGMDKSKIKTIGEKIVGLRFMGQRFTPDSYIMQVLTHPTVQNRWFPKGLDILAVLGSSRAEEHLESDKEEYENYTLNLERLKKEFNSLSPDNWTQNLYWSWLNTIRENLISNYTGYPTFMRTTAWLDEKLNTALGSWVELRHDTILYNKQPSVPRGLGVEFWGYVEPMINVYNLLLALSNATLIGLKKLGIPNFYSSALETFIDMTSKLVEISRKELLGEPLSESDYRVIQAFGLIIRGIIDSLHGEVTEFSIITDVFTVYDRGLSILEEANGLIEPIIVVYVDSNGELRAAIGGVFSYYEFITYNNRLTDEEWLNILLSSNIPERPSWTQSFLA